MSDYRVCNTEDLLRLNQISRSQGLSRTLNLTPYNLDRDGTHLLILVLWGHNADAGGELHHRTRVLIKLLGTDQPLEGWLDIEATIWNSLQDRRNSMKYPEVTVRLIGEDGNAYAIMGAVGAALRRNGVSAEEIEKYHAESMSGDYDNLLRTAMEWVNVE